MGLIIDLTPVTDADPLAWWVGRIAAERRSVGAFMPDGFEAYARVLHPGVAWAPPDGTQESRLVPWSQIAAWSGKQLVPTSSIQSLTRHPEKGSWHRPGVSMPSTSQMVRTHLERLTEILTGATTTPERLWLLVWGGWNGLETRVSRHAVHTAEGIRGGFLFRGAITPDEGGASGGPPQVGGGLPIEYPPSFWWPDDRAWMVSTDIDAVSTYVGGMAALIDQLLADDLLEVFPARLSDPFAG